LEGVEAGGEQEAARVDRRRLGCDEQLSGTGHWIGTVLETNRVRHGTAYGLDGEPNHDWTPLWVVAAFDGGDFQGPVASPN
jgi:hypothetical protein